MSQKSEILVQHLDAPTQCINNLALCLKLFPKLFQFFNSFKPSELKRRKDLANTFGKLTVSIPAKTSHIREVKDFMDSLYEHLSESEMLFFRIKIAVLETVRCIVFLNRRRDRHIEVSFVKMKKHIEITISCTSKNKKHYAPWTPLPWNEFDLEDRMGRFGFMKRFSDKVSFFGEGTGVVMSFRLSARVRKNKRIC